LDGEGAVLHAWLRLALLVSPGADAAYVTNVANTSFYKASMEAARPHAAAPSVLLAKGFAILHGFRSSHGGTHLKQAEGLRRMHELAMFLR
jgi:hypothetical protein